MIVLIIVFSVLILLALMRLGLYVEYGGDGTSVLLMVGPVPVRFLPKKEKGEKQALRKLKKEEKKAIKKAEEAKTKKPGGVKGFFDKLPVILKGFGRFRRKLLVKKLTIRFVSADVDPSKTALIFGASNATLGVIVSLLENSFRVKCRDISTSADFEATQSTIYIKIAISLALWEAIYVFTAILPLFVKSSVDKPIAPKGRNIRKDDN